jgi:hypothetical protein
MDTVTYPDARVAQMVMQHFVPARVEVKREPNLVEEYLVAWMPHLVIIDDQGTVHYRLEGYLAPEEFMAYLSLGLGKLHLNRGQFFPAAERFEGVVQRHRGTDAGAEALYWLGVTHYKQTHDPAELRRSWQQLTQEHSNSTWAHRTRIPTQE